MFFFTVVFALAFLSGSLAKLPNFGKCTYMEYYCDGRKCDTLFFKSLQEDPKGNCSAKFNKMIHCVAKSTNICFENKLTESQIIGIVRQTLKEVAMCSDGALEIPTLPPTGTSLCSASFNSDANACMRTFKETFAADKSDPSLCTENAKAKQCLKKLYASDCNYPSATQEILDLAVSDYNPFCANNRDPGATGKGMCDGVKDLNNPLNSGAVAGLKISVLQALLFSFVLLLFFVEV